MHVLIARPPSRASGLPRKRAARGAEWMRRAWTLEDYRESVLPLIEERLRTSVGEGELGDLYRYVVEGGKRLRPTMTLLVSDALGGDRAMALDLACSVELTHCASLCLDDILDGHGQRRGKTALHLARGLREAVTTGFTLPSVALNLAARHGAQYAQILSDAWVSMCLGVHLEENAAVTWEAYLDNVELKTGRLFGAACTFGALATKRTGQGFRRYGLHLGNAFQMADDLLDGWEEAWVPRLRRRMAAEVRRAEDRTTAWEGARPELIRLLRAAPKDVIALKGISA